MDVYQSLVRFLTLGVALLKFGSTVSIATKVYTCRTEFEQRSFIPDINLFPEARKGLMYIGCLLYIGLTAGCIILILNATLGLVATVASKGLLIFSFGILSIFAFILEITTVVTLFKVSSSMDEAIGEPIRQIFETIFQQRDLMYSYKLPPLAQNTRNTPPVPIFTDGLNAEDYYDENYRVGPPEEGVNPTEEGHHHHDDPPYTDQDPMGKSNGGANVPPNLRNLEDFTFGPNVPDDLPNLVDGDPKDPLPCLDLERDPLTEAYVNTYYLNLRMLEYLQNMMQCCGVDGPSFWLKTVLNGTLPQSCCLFSLATTCTTETAFQRGCLTGLSECRDCFFILQMSIAVFSVFSFLSFALAMMYTVLNHKYPPLLDYGYDLPSSSSDNSLQVTPVSYYE